jgi:putative spermidine/putrescine transport system permease protein
MKTAPSATAARATLRPYVLLAPLFLAALLFLAGVAGGVLQGFGALSDLFPDDRRDSYPEAVGGAVERPRSAAAPTASAAETPRSMEADAPYGENGESSASDRPGTRRGLSAAVLFSGVLSSLLVAFLAVLIACMAARALCLYEFRWRRALFFVGALPIMVAATLLGLGAYLYFAGAHWGDSHFAVPGAQLICALPFTLKIATESLNVSGPELEEHARVLGATPWGALLYGSFPVLLPCTLSAGFIAFLLSLTQYFLIFATNGGGRTTAGFAIPLLQRDGSVSAVHSAVFLLTTLLVFLVFQAASAAFSGKDGAKHGL